MFRKFAVLLFVMLLATPVLADEVSTKYISVDLPDNWKAVMAPTENQGTTTVIFSNASGSSTVGFVTGPNGGADTKTVAEMFANQFKALKPPVEKNGQYTFAFTQQQTPCQSGWRRLAIFLWSRPSPATASLAWLLSKSM